MLYRSEFLPRSLEGSQKGMQLRDVFPGWFHEHLVPAACARSREAGPGDSCKTLLFLDSHRAAPPAEILINEKCFCLVSSITASLV